MVNERLALVGAVSMSLISPDGRVLAEAVGHNRVLRLGRSLAAQALAGTAGLPVFKILLGSDGSASQDDDLKSLLKPIGENQYAVDTTAPVPAVDAAGAAFKLMSTFTAQSAMNVGESGIQVTMAAQTTTTSPTTRPTLESLPSLTRDLTAPILTTVPTAAAPILYNRAVISPAVTLRAGDKLTVTWTVSFVPA